MNPLERAADLIEQRGWCQGRFKDDDGRICLDFALISADLERNADARWCVSKELQARGVSCDGLVSWNDGQARDKSEVVELLRQSARRWPPPPRTRRLDDEVA